jgi:hypothetical protein
VHLQWVQHTLTRDDDLFGSLLLGKRSDQRGHFLSSLPLSQLSKSLLPRPHTRMNNFQEQLPRPGIKNENRPVDRFRG